MNDEGGAAKRCSAFFCHRHSAMPEVTRFAPSPTGWLHLGHAFAALFAHDAAGAGGRFLIRLEDIDGTRSRPEYEAAIFEDLAWLGLSWEMPVRRQSDHFEDYRAALARLDAQGLLYPCFCTRREIQEEIARAGSAPQGPDGPLYPGICRHLDAEERARRISAGAAYALRLDVAKALQHANKPLAFIEKAHGEITADPTIFGDVVLARKDTPASYHLAVVVDDALQGITLVTRGEDLLPATHLHRLLQELLGLPVPRWHHHHLITDENGKRLAKRDDARSLRSLRDAGWTPARVVEAVRA
jgi:glutamyl-Q tRNA(Asp) synthetase